MVGGRGYPGPAPQRRPQMTYQRVRKNIEGWPARYVKTEIEKLRAEGCRKFENVDGYFISYDKPVAS